MAGHSHWAGIKHKKAAVDKARGKLWSKLARNIISAARTGGSDPEGNLRLKYAIEKAKAANMPKDTIERNVKKGAGELDGAAFEELTYEGYGAGGVAVIVEALTDNRNRTAPEVIKIFEKHGGNLGKPGSVARFFDKKAVYTVDAEKMGEDELMEIALECGAEDLKNEGSVFEIVADPAQFIAVKQALEAANVPLESADLSQIPNMTVAVDANAARKLLKLMESLEDHDDVQGAYANFDLSDEVMAELED